VDVREGISLGTRMRPRDGKEQSERRALGREAVLSRIGVRCRAEFQPQAEQQFVGATKRVRAAMQMPQPEQLFPNALVALDVRREGGWEDERIM